MIKFKLLVTIKLFEDEIAMIKGMKHDSPYHAEDVDTHIQMTIDGAKAQSESIHYTKDGNCYFSRITRFR